MSAEIWFFFTPDGEKQITVLNRQSAEDLVALMTQEQRRLWKCRKNRSTDTYFIHECHELLPKHEQILQGPQDIEDPAELFNELKQESSGLHSVYPQSPQHQHQSQPQLPRKEHQPAETAPDTSTWLAQENTVWENTQAGVPPVQAQPQQPQNHQVQAPVMPHQQPVQNELPPQPTQVEAPAEAPVVEAPPAPANFEAFAEKRRYKRYLLRLRVVLIAGNRSFRTFSRDVSKGGMSFEHVVPKELIGQTCRVIIGSSDMKENLEFDARLAGDPHNPRAVAFKEESNQEIYVKKLESWLEEVEGRQSTGTSAA